MVSGVHADMVTAFLTANGIATGPVHFGCSDIVIGRKVRLPELEFVYRQEGSELIICHLAAGEVLSGGRGAVAAFIRLITMILAGVPQLSLVRGLFLEGVPGLSVNVVKDRLIRVLERKGASWKDVAGECWLAYDRRAGMA